MSNPETNDLPEGVIDADPAGGWESEDVIDDETRQRSEAEAVDAGLPSDAADAGDTATGHEVEANEDVESAEVTQGVDPDLATDDGAE